jgi:hypothetical protein
MRLHIAWTFVALVLTVACGEQDDGLPETPPPQPRPDAGSGPVDCTPPTSAPDPDGMMGPCCYRVSNADRLDAPELRLSGIGVTSPISLANAVVDSLLSTGFDGETFNWLVQGTVTGTDVTLRTGYGMRNGDASFSFTSGAAPVTPENPDPNRWDPVDLTGTLTGEVLSTPPYGETLTIPAFDSADPTVLLLELPFKSLTIEMATLSESRSCVGARVRNRYETSSGRLTGFLTVEESDASALVIEGILDTTLCMFIAGMSGDPGTCADVPQTGWDTKPDSLCDASGCALNPMGTTDVCDPASTCNAWQIVAGFAAQGVEIR